MNLTRHVLKHPVNDYVERSARPVVMDDTRLQGTAWSLDSPHRPTSTSKTAPLHKDSAGVDQRLRINLEKLLLQHPLCPDPTPLTYLVTKHSSISDRRPPPANKNHLVFMHFSLYTHV